MAASESQEGAQASRYEHWSSVAGIAVGVLLIAVAILAYVVFFRVGNAEESIGLNALQGLVLLSATLAGLIILTKSLGLSERTAALGLPKGSVRALLAFSLVIVFVSVASWNLGNLFDPTVRKGPLVPTDSAAAAAADSFTAHGAAAWFAQETGANGRSIGFRVYYLTKRDPNTQEQVLEIASQIMTIVATVLVTVVGFYFGSSSAVDGVNTAKSTIQSVRDALGGGDPAGRTFTKADIEKAVLAVSTIATGLETAFGEIKDKRDHLPDEELKRLYDTAERIVRARLVDAERVAAMSDELGNSPDQARLDEAGKRAEWFRIAATDDQKRFNEAYEKVRAAPDAAEPPVTQPV